MATRKLSRKMRPRWRKGEEQQQICDDRISYLSDDILMCVLSRIPLGEAVRTSVLSKRWTYLWCSIPYLELGEFGMDLVYDEDGMRQWAYVVRHIMDSRQAPILSCKIDAEMSEELNADLDEFILFLCKNGIQDLYLDNPWYYYQFPTDAYFCQSLNKLTLDGCEVVLPPFFEGISCLTSLTFICIIISDDDLERLISSCRLLEIFCFKDTFALESFEESEWRNLRISALNLLSLELCSWRPTHISLKAVPCLKNVFYRPCDFSDDIEANMLVELLMNLVHVESLKLELFQNIPETLDRLNLLKSLPALKLKKLALRADSDVTRLLSCFLRSCPNLEELNIFILEGLEKEKGFVQELYWKRQGPFDCLMYHLTTVRIKVDYLNSSCGIGFAEFLLKNAYVLKKMSISYSMGVKEQVEAEISELLLLQRASPHVVLEFNIEPVPSVIERFFDLF
ncbi:F-box/FBD/LRR-repeat protein At1g13570-like isoform X1 [Tasmannia lanceolata]|uniref:F-box/FBD/LRR-repeat protein At1g13570-like isoform X1 n=1 Tax=Tasmannia lanceolata TaxID=3420 RepID=UPI004062F562